MTTPQDTQAQNSKSAGQESPQDKKVGLGQVIISTLAAALGVQSNKNRERDFSGGNLKVYIASGIIFTLVFIGSLILLVRYLLAQH